MHVDKIHLMIEHQNYKMLYPQKIYTISLRTLWDYDLSHLAFPMFDQ